MSFYQVRVIFIIPESCEDETQTAVVMQDVYSLCKQNLMKTSWVQEVDGEGLDLQKTDFLVFQDFSGALYEKAVNTKCVRILGPRCLLACLTKPKPIPNVDWPLHNLAMDGCIVTCSNLPKERKQEIRTKVQAMGGLVTTTLVVANTHLITDSVKSEKYNIAAPSDVKVMLPVWVDEVWQCNQHDMIEADDARFAKYKCLPFHNLVISSTGFTFHADKDRLANVVSENGGTFTKQLHLKSTDILVCNGSSTEKYKAARKRNIDCVTAEWIWESADVGYAIPDIKKYSVKKGTSTPTKLADQIDPNFSMMSAINGTYHSHSVLQETINVTSMNNFASPSVPANTTKRKSPLKPNELIDCIDIKKVKRSGEFLDGCSIFLAGFNPEQHEKLCKVLNFSGAVRCDTLTERITHIIVGDPSSHELKFISNKNYQCCLVSVKWLIDSMEQQHPVSEEEYLISSVTSPGAEQGSPLVKKGLRLLRTDVSVLEHESTLEPVYQKENDVEVNEEDAILLQYLKPHSESQEDTLAAILLANKLDGNKSIVPSKQDSIAKSHGATITNREVTFTNTDVTMPRPGASNRSSLSISISCEESQGYAIFQGITFIIANYNMEDTQDIHDAIQEMGGTVVNEHYEGVPDYAIVPVTNSVLKQSVSEIVTDLWLTECKDTQGIPEIMYYHRPFTVQNATVMKGRVIAISGFYKCEKSFLKSICESFGAIVQDSMARKQTGDNIYACTHLISSTESGKKYEAAIKWGLPVLSKDWVLACAEHGKFIEEYDYLLESSKENYSGNNTTLKEPKQVQSVPISTKKVGNNMTLNEPKQVQSVPISTKVDQLNNSRLNVSISSTNKVYGNINAKETNSRSSTPLAQQAIGKKASEFFTPPNNASPLCSQITPVNQIMKDMRSNYGINAPVTPTPWNFVQTPTSPLGAYICDPPPPELRKKFARWINGLPDAKPPRERRISTPLSELKKRLWNQICPDLRNNECNRIQQPNFDVVDESQVEPLPVTPRTNFEETPENLLLDEKLQHLQDALSNGSSRRSSIRNREPILREECHEKESQPFSVGWEEPMECRNVYSKAESPQKVVSPALFMISGVDDGEKELLLENIEELGASVSSLANYDPASTHLLCKKLNRSEKLLASMAAGKWILHISYIEDSMKSRKLLNEEEYEFGNPRSKLRVDRESKERAKCVNYWRKEISRRGYGAFHDVKAIVVASKRENLIRVIEAGGGMVIDACPPFPDSIFATHCLMEPKSVSKTSDYVPLAKKGVYCVNTMYVNDFLHRTDQDIKEYLLPSFSKYY